MAALETAQKPRRHWVRILPLALAVFIWAIDQGVKIAVIEHLPQGEVYPVVGEALQLVHVRNPGAAFSLGNNATWIFTLLSVGVIGYVVTLIPKLQSVRWGVFIGLLLGGVLGNLTDRLIREPGFAVGHVVDYIFTPWMMPAVYNIADVCIVTSMCLLVLLTLLGVKLRGAVSEKSSGNH